MLVPSYIEDSNRHYINRVDNLISFQDKIDRAYFTGTLTGGFPCYEHRANIINEINRINIIDKLIRVHTHENHVILKWIYDYIIPNNFKQPMVDYPTFLNEINESKYVFALKGNGLDPTRRYFESIAFNCLTFLSKNNYTEYIGKSIPNVHHIEIELDGSDVVNKLLYYVQNPHESENIANAGHSFWKSNCVIFNNDKLNDNVERHICNFMNRILNITI